MADVHAQHKRSHTSFLFMGEQSTNPITATKRLRTTPATTISPNPKEKKKDKIGERVAALQQLVSPFGKTDTASVLLEATEYVRFLHDQLQVLSAPYIATAAAGKEAGNNNSLRSRGLCLAPVSSTLTVARSNGADIWAPINTSKHT